MNDKMSKKKWHINKRILVLLVILMTMVFTSVFLAFNIFVRGYIRSNVDIQLSGLVKNMPKHFNDDRNDKNNGGNYNNGQSVPDLSNQPKSKVGAKGEVFIANADYTVADYMESSNKEELSQIIKYLKEKNIPLDNADSVYVKTLGEEYYISSIPDKFRENAFMVLYVNVSVLNNLVRTVNVSLGIILVVAMVFCLFTANSIAKSVTRPVKEISDFSREIGKGNFKRSDLVFSDIEFDQLIKEMNEAAEKLDKYDSEQKIFFQNVSHELRTPLMSIRCLAEGIAYGLMDAEKTGSTIIVETDRLSALVEDLLYISRMDSTKNKIEFTENDLRETISMAASALQPVAKKKGIFMKYDFDSNPVIFSYNENQLYRAVLNLISNGIRYAKTSITLKCHQNNNKITLSVSDDGDGILKEELPHIFERFYKGEGGKHGVGLSIVKSVVDGHNGSITVNQENETTFKITFLK